MPYTIRCDYRENRGGCVIDKLRECRAALTTAATFDLINEVLTTGDYVIQAGSYILIIERKTWDDLAASIKDGRIFANHKKMLDAAAAGFRIMYLIEGRAPEPSFASHKFGGITVDAMMAKLDHFAMRDNVWVEYTRSAHHTAQRLIELGKHLSTLLPPESKTVAAATHGITMVDGSGPPTVSQAPATNTTPTTAAVDAIVKKKHEKPINVARHEMLMCIGGIGEKTAVALMAAHSFTDIVNARGINPEIVSTAAAAELRELAAGRRHSTYVDMLATVKGVSDKTAQLVAFTVTLAQITTRNPATTATIANLRIGAPPRRLGDKLAETIVTHFSDATPLPTPSIAHLPAPDVPKVENSA